MEDNRNFIQDNNIFDHTYFNFMWQMVGFIPTTLTSSTSTTSSSQVCQGLVVDRGVYTYHTNFFNFYHIFFSGMSRSCGRSWGYIPTTLTSTSTTSSSQVCQGLVVDRGVYTYHTNFFNFCHIILSGMSRSCGRSWGYIPTN